MRLTLLLCTLLTLPLHAVELLPCEALRAGQHAYGLTVFKGTTIERFDVEILGVLPQADFDGDWILARVTSGPLLARGGGILAGMSGSPIYVDDKLVGAAAFATSAAMEPVFFIQPIQQMLRVLDDSNKPLPAARSARLPQRAAGVTVAGRRYDRVRVGAPGEPRPTVAGELGVVPLQTPLMVSGLGAGGLRALTALLAPYGLQPVQGPGGGGGTAGPDLVPGAAMAVELASGDVSAAAIGTVTWRDGNRILGFGHPMMQRNRVALPLCSAAVLDFVTTYTRSFKIGLALAPVGTLTQDGHYAVAGTLGPAPATIPLTIALTDADTGTQRQVNVRLADDDLLAPGLALGMAMDAASTWIGTEREAMFSTRCEVVLRDGTVLSRREEGLLNAPQQSLVDLQQSIMTVVNNPFREQQLAGLKVAITLRRGDQTGVIARAYVDRAVVEPGETVQVALDLRRRADGAVQRVTVPLTVPRKAQAGKARLMISGGAGEPAIRNQLKILDAPPANSAQYLARFAASDADNRSLVAILALPQTDLAVRGETFPIPPPFADDLLSSASTTDLQRGQTMLRLVLPSDLVILNSASSNLTIGDPPAEGGAAQPNAVQVWPGLPTWETAAWRAPEWLLTACGVAPPGDELSWLEPLQGGPGRPLGPTVGSAASGPAPVAPSPAGAPAAPAGEAKADDSTRTARVFVHNSAKDFLPGTLHDTSVVADGAVALGCGTKRLLTADEPAFWAVAAAPDGTVYAGSGNGGQLYRVAPDGQSKVVAQVAAPVITAVAVRADGIWFASAPDGVVWRLAPDGQVSQVAKTGCAYVWQLLPTPDGALAAAGAPGKLLRIAGGQVSTLWDADAGHVLAVRPAPDGSLVVAGGAPGFVVRWRQHPVTTLAMTATPISALAVLPDGNVLFGDGPLLVTVRPDGRLKADAPFDGPVILALLPSQAGVLVAVRAKQPQGPAALWMVEPGGGRRRQAFTSAVFAFTALAPAPDGSLLAATANPAQVWRLTQPFAPAGTYESAVLDGGGVAAYGAVEVQRQLPEGGAVQVETRSGNTIRPGDDWSPWVAAVDAVHSPPARFLQYRLTLTTAKVGSPVVESVRIWYSLLNVAPQISLEAPVLGDAWRGKQSVKFKVSDPNGDNPLVTIAARAEDSQEWQTLAPPCTASSGKLEVDTSKLPDGRYRLRLVVDDGVANPDQPLVTTLLSDLLLIDNTAPTLSPAQPTWNATADRLIWQAAARDNLLLRAVDWRLNQDPWLPGRATDGLLDSALETVALRTVPVPVGKHTLEIRLRDAAGNETSVKHEVVRQP
ncbi:MAG: hypothetical protein IT204_24985 [Fimbriimonadaceae bacterium]|nr:hypothetical protein [Fimbriimonadaceae bacterium]